MPLVESTLRCLSVGVNLTVEYEKHKTKLSMIFDPKHVSDATTLRISVCYNDTNQHPRVSQYNIIINITIFMRFHVNQTSTVVTLMM